MSFEDDLHRLRPSNFYPPEGFYQSGSWDPFWSRDEEGSDVFPVPIAALSSPHDSHGSGWHIFHM